jgi:hypothetical protein
MDAESAGKSERSRYFIAYVAMFSAAYVLAASFYSSSFNPVNDGLEYKKLYDSVFYALNIYGLESVLPRLMYVSSWIGLDYRDFLLAFSIFWLPVIIYFIWSTRSDCIFLIISAFFLSCLFFDSSYFLMRQFSGTLFFCFSLIVQRKSAKIVYLCLAVLSHLAIIIWIPALYSSVRNKIIHGRFFALIFFVSFALYIFGLLPRDEILSGLNWLSGYFSWSGELGRKFGYYNSSQTVDAALSRSVLFVIFISGAILLLFRPSNRIQNKVIETILSIMLFSSVICFVFSANPILANRVGFMAYFFAIPYFSFSLWKTDLLRRLKFMLFPS